MATPLKLPRLRTDFPIVDKNGIPTREFTRFWDEVCTLLEDAINGIVSVESQFSDAIGGVAELRADIEELKRLFGAREEVPYRAISDLQILMPPP